MTYTEIIDGEPTEVVVQDPIPATHEEVEQAREKAYESLVDHLHLRKIRKTVLGEWTEELEAEYVAEVKEKSAKVVELHPYPEDLVVVSETENTSEEPETEEIPVAEETPSEEPIVETEE